MFKCEVIADASGKWFSNALTFATAQEAEEYGQDLAMRWTAVRDWRVVKVSDLSATPQTRRWFTLWRTHCWVPVDVYLDNA